MSKIEAFHQLKTFLNPFNQSPISLRTEFELSDLPQCYEGIMVKENVLTKILLLPLPL